MKYNLAIVISLTIAAGLAISVGVDILGIPLPTLPPTFSRYFFGTLFAAGGIALLILAIRMVRK